MLERLKRLYAAGRLTETGLNNAKNKKWISEEEKQEILNSKILQW